MGTLHVRILGRLWMPQCLAATSVTIDTDRYSWEDSGLDPTNADDVDGYVDRHHGGDFSAIVALEAIYVEQTDHHSHVSVSSTDQTTVMRVRYTVRETTVIEMSEADECAWHGCMAGADWYAA
jgi:hypothetical protein